MHMPLVTGTVAGEAIDVLLALNVPNVDAFGPINCNRDGPVVFTDGCFIELDVLLVGA
jgi:hypothetical protein